MRGNPRRGHERGRPSSPRRGARRRSPRRRRRGSREGWREDGAPWRGGRRPPPAEALRESAERYNLGRAWGRATTSTRSAEEPPAAVSVDSALAHRCVSQWVCVHREMYLHGAGVGGSARFDPAPTRRHPRRARRRQRVPPETSRSRSNPAESSFPGFAEEPKFRAWLVVVPTWKQARALKAQVRANLGKINAS